MVDASSCGNFGIGIGDNIGLPSDSWYIGQYWSYHLIVGMGGQYWSYHQIVVDKRHSHFSLVLFCHFARMASHLKDRFF